MWQKYWVPAFILTTLLSSAPISANPSNESAWALGRSAFGKGDYSQSTLYLKQFVESSPGLEGFLDAHFLLGLSYMRPGENQKAIQPLRYYSEAKGNTTDQLRGRLELLEAYLFAGEPTKALLNALELTSQKASPIMTPEIYLRSLLLKAKAQLDLKQSSAAALTLRDFFEEIPSSSEFSPLRCRGYLFQIEHQLHKCEQFPGKGPSDETETRAQLKLRSTCLKEGLLIFQKMLKEPSAEWVQQARKELERGYGRYASVTYSPPLAPGNRTSIQQRRYREELVDVLGQDLQEELHSALDILRSWKENGSETEKAQLQRLIKVLETTQHAPAPSR